MNWINRYIDHPILDGAASALRLWHTHSRQMPDQLEPVWNIGVLSALLIASSHFLEGRALTLGIATLLMLALPSIRKLVSAWMRDSNTYDAREYKVLRARAIFNREGQWSLRLMVLVAASCLPFLAHTEDPTGSSFVFGACVWFVLTAPAKFYLDAAEPPAPSDGDRAAFDRGFRFGQA